MKLYLTISAALLVGVLAGYACFARIESRAASSPPRRALSELAGPSVSSGVRVDRQALLFEAVTDSRDRLRCLRDLYLAVQRLQPGDFTLFEDSDALTKRLSDVPYWCAEALLGGFTERWLEVDPARALAWLERTPDFLKDTPGVDGATRVFARKSPDAVLQFALSKRGTEQQRKGFAQLLVEEVGEQDLARAKKLIAAFPDKAMRLAAETGWRNAFAKSDPVAAADVIATMEDRNAAQGMANAAIAEASRRGAGVLRLLASKLTDADMRVSLGNAMAAYDVEEAANIAGEVLANWSSSYPPGLARFYEALVRQDAMRAAEWASALPQKPGRDALGTVAKLWAAQDPAAALAWLQEHPQKEPADAAQPLGERNDARLEVFDVWLRREEAAARAWAAALPRGELREAMDARFITHLTERHRASEAAAIFAQSGSDAKPSLARRVTEELARDHPLAAAQWAVDLPAGRAQSLAIAAAVKSWAQRDPQAAAEWVGQFPLGEARDQAAAAYAQTSAIVNPTTAAEWVLEVADPWKRTMAAQTVFWHWSLRDPEAAHVWFKTVPGVNEAIRREALQDVK